MKVVIAYPEKWETRPPEDIARYNETLRAINPKAEIVIADAERHARIAAHVAECPDIQRVVVTRAASQPPATIAFESIIGAPDDWAALRDAPLPEIALEPDDDACCVRLHPVS